MTTNRTAYCLFTNLFGVGLTFLAASGALIAGSQEDLNFDKGPSTQVVKTHSDRLAKGHDCWTSGRDDLPNAAIITYWGQTTSHYTTDPAQVDDAFNFALGQKNAKVYSVDALCID